MAFFRFLAGLLVIVGFAGILVLGAMADAAGNPGLGLGMIAGLVILMVVLTGMGWFLKSRSRRALTRYHQAVALGVSAPGRTLRAEESESYPCDADTVWSLIRPAESAVLLSNAARAFTVPGTPTGVGEQQTFVRADGSAATVEVVEEAAPYWAKTITVAPTKDGMVQTYQIEPSESGCTLTMGMTATIPAIPGFSRRYEKMWRKDARRYLSRVKETVISGAAR
ncbi:SRPBCC family protein [Arthrobacter sp. M-10]|uniref:SRPBCC family protein n=1 Tax=unclassified Arthrobacter TaxID=235627 RepID=UPI003F9322AD